MNIPDPRNPSDAWQQARILERANRLYADGYRAQYRPEDDTILVTNEEGTTYQVSVIFETCDCPFYAERNFCKHSFGAQKLLQETQAEQREIEEANACEMDLATYRRFKDPFCEE